MEGRGGEGRGGEGRGREKVKRITMMLRGVAKHALRHTHHRVKACAQMCFFSAPPRSFTSVLHFLIPIGIQSLPYSASGCPTQRPPPRTPHREASAGLSHTQGSVSRAPLAGLCCTCRGAGGWQTSGCHQVTCRYHGRGRTRKHALDTESVL